MKIRYFMSALAATALIGCAGAPAAVEPGSGAAPAGDRQVLAAGVEAGLEEALAQLPERIPVDEAEGLLVRISDDQVAAARGGFGVLNNDDDDDKKPRRRIVRSGIWPYFGSAFSSLYYYPYSNYYFPYVRAGGYYYPFRTAREALYGDPLISGGPFYNIGGGSYFPFLYGYGGAFSPFYWRWR